MPVSVLVAKTRKRKTPKTLPDNMKEVCSVVKCGLSKKCKSPILFSAIQDDVEAISSLTVEVSVYMHFKLNKDWANGVFKKIIFLDYFYALKKGGLSKYELDIEYKSLRGRHLKDLHDGSYRSNIFCFAARQYETVFVNNIWIHAYKRLRNFLRRFGENAKAVYETLDFLFTQKSKHKPNANLINMMKIHLGHGGSVRSTRHKIQLLKAPSIVLQSTAI